ETKKPAQIDNRQDAPMKIGESQEAWRRQRHAGDRRDSGHFADLTEPKSKLAVAEMKNHDVRNVAGRGLFYGVPGAFSHGAPEYLPPAKRFLRSQRQPPRNRAPVVSPRPTPRRPRYRHLRPPPRSVERRE